MRVPANERNQVFPRERGDAYGRLNIAGVRPYLTDRKLRKLQSGRARLFHRVRNGVYDPMTWYHLVYSLNQIQGNRPFTASALTEYLNQHTPQFIWDATTVGRILHDISESFSDIEGEHNPIKVKRSWDGAYYEVAEGPQARHLLINLQEDVLAAANQVAEAESRGERPNRLSSPASSLPIFVAPFAVEA